MFTPYSKKINPCPKILWYQILYVKIFSKHWKFHTSKDDHIWRFSFFLHFPITLTICLQKDKSIKDGYIGPCAEEL